MWENWSHATSNRLPVAVWVHYYKRKISNKRCSTSHWSKYNKSPLPQYVQLTLAGHQENNSRSQMSQPVESNPLSFYPPSESLHFCVMRTEYKSNVNILHFTELPSLRLFECKWRTLQTDSYTHEWKVDNGLKSTAHTNIQYGQHSEQWNNLNNSMQSAWFYWKVYNFTRVKEVLTSISFKSFRNWSSLT